MNIQVREQQSSVHIPAFVPKVVEQSGVSADITTASSEEFSLSWEEFCEKLKEYLASRGDLNPEEAVAGYKETLILIYRECIAGKKLTPKKLAQELFETAVPILGY